MGSNVLSGGAENNPNQQTKQRLGSVYPDGLKTYFSLVPSVPSDANGSGTEEVAVDASDLLIRSHAM